MDEKFFVPFETALLLKKKGYNDICDYYYAPDKQLYFGVTRVSNITKMRLCQIKYTIGYLTILLKITESFLLMNWM